MSKIHTLYNLLDDAFIEFEPSDWLDIMFRGYGGYHSESELKDAYEYDKETYPDGAHVVKITVEVLYGLDIDNEEGKRSLYEFQVKHRTPRCS